MAVLGRQSLYRTLLGKVSLLSPPLSKEKRLSFTYLFTVEVEDDRVHPTSIYATRRIRPLDQQARIACSKPRTATFAFIRSVR